MVMSLGNPSQLIDHPTSWKMNRHLHGWRVPKSSGIETHYSLFNALLRTLVSRMNSIMFPTTSILEESINSGILCPVIGHGDKLYVQFLILYFGLKSDGLQDKISELPNAKGAFFVPIILGSDKTTVSVATGNNEYWPVYLSIGNIHNTTRRAHRNGVVVIAFLSIPKGVLIQHTRHFFWLIYTMTSS